MTAGLLAALITFFLFLVGHALLFQLFTITKRFNAMALTWFILLAAYAALYAMFLHYLPVTYVHQEPALSLPGLVGIVNGAVILPPAS